LEIRSFRPNTMRAREPGIEAVWQLAPGPHNAITGWKGGIGTASRITPDATGSFTPGALV
jgi:hypothetical protein